MIKKVVRLQILFVKFFSQEAFSHLFVSHLSLRKSSDVAIATGCLCYTSPLTYCQRRCYIGKHFVSLLLCRDSIIL